VHLADNAIVFGFVFACAQAIAGKDIIGKVDCVQRGAVANNDSRCPSIADRRAESKGKESKRIPIYRCGHRLAPSVSVTRDVARKNVLLKVKVKIKLQCTLIPILIPIRATLCNNRPECACVCLSAIGMWINKCTRICHQQEGSLFFR